MSALNTDCDTAEMTPIAAPTYKAKHVASIFAEDVYLLDMTAKAQGSQPNINMGMIEIFRSGFGVLHYAKNGLRSHATLGPQDLWVLRQSGVLYFLGLKVRFKSRDLNSVISDDPPTVV